MNKQKRMIYIYEENLDFYDELENKSQWINDKLQDARVNTRLKDAVEPITPGEPITPEQDPNWHPDPRIRDVRKQLAAMEARDKAAQNK